jgi:hypothetical protein
VKKCVEERSKNVWLEILWAYIFIKEIKGWMCCDKEGFPDCEILRSPNLVGPARSLHLHRLAPLIHNHISNKDQ